MNKIPMVVKNTQSDLEIIDKVLTIYSVVKEIPLRPFERLVLKYYIKYGYTQDAKKYLMEDAKRKPSDIKTADFHLRSKGFLHQLANNEKDSRLSDDMEVVRKHFVLTNESKLYLISFAELENGK